MKEALLLLSMQGVVGGITVKYQLLRWAWETGNELIDQYFVQSPGCLPIGSTLQSIQSGCAGHG